MLEAARNSLSNFANDPRTHEWVAQHLPDEYVEYLITENKYWELERRAPGKYTVLLNTLNALSNFNPLTRFYIGPASSQGISPAALPSYKWGRWNDDIADGHLPLPSGYSSYEELVQAQKEIITSGGEDVVKGFTIEFLLKRVIAKLERVQKRDDNVGEDLSVFLDAMQTEYLRRVERKVSTSQELSDLYANSFGRPHNIMLIALGSSARESQIRELSQILGRRYNCEGGSLHEDLPRGICYIPSEVLSSSGFSLDELMQNPSFSDTNPTIQEWVSGEIRDCSGLYDTLSEKIEDLDWRAREYVGRLTKDMIPRFNNLP
ncbi:hypothetical protein A3A75_03245 [Candidatus Woesebacteria bacterium RIFCSPLOWO2_01_FULL_39_10]|uniref:Uncharacterized protein n=1 Tax=Candidatus Woesebacteria bacterium RIFCSPLOWO2_01_FULL_39_10 TaxID=1802516 RepID=A0A1F8B586_9BACT|nr:MAG: hypothetical protein A3A75_03245 [Candidatus Woesebacteria bacterium RIFCSPLOWO2_01_FULL_39_10]